jgi:hypothetical protein
VIATVKSVERKKRRIVLRGATSSVPLQIALDAPLNDIAAGDNLRARYRAEAAMPTTRGRKPNR